VLQLEPVDSICGESTDTQYMKNLQNGKLVSLMTIYHSFSSVSTTVDNIVREVYYP